MENKIFKFKKQIEYCILNAHYKDSKGDIKKCENGHKALGNYIRSKLPINNIHEAIKETFIKKYNVPPSLIFPPLNQTSPELKIVGKIKDKTQDICIVSDKRKTSQTIETYLGAKQDELGIKFIRHTLIINVRSQIVSVSKNTDTILERTFAEPINLNLRDENIVLGEFFLIPVKEIDIAKAKNNEIGYKKIANNSIEKYINFFINMRDKENKSSNEKLISYSECCLILVDFDREVPKIYKKTDDLLKDKVVSKNYNKEVNNLYFYKAIDNLYKKYCNLAKSTSST